MPFRWPRGEAACLRRSVFGRDINVDSFSARDSVISNSYPSKSYHSHVGSQCVFLHMELRSNMEILCYWIIDFLSLCERHPRKRTGVGSWRWNCIMLYGVRFGPMSGLPFWHHISQISFSLSYFNLLIGDTLTHFVLGDCELAVSLCNSTFLPISPALPP